MNAMAMNGGDRIQLAPLRHHSAAAGVVVEVVVAQERTLVVAANNNHHSHHTLVVVPAVAAEFVVAAAAAAAVVDVDVLGEVEVAPYSTETDQRSSAHHHWECYWKSSQRWYKEARNAEVLLHEEEGAHTLQA